MPKMRKFNTKSMKISTAQVREMYQRLQNGELTQGQAALEYGLGVIQVGRIARGESRAAETGAQGNMIPNFAMQTGPADIAESLAKLDERLGKPAPSLYDSPPPTLDEDNAAAERAFERLEGEVKPIQQISDELGKLEKGD